VVTRLNHGLDIGGKPLGAPTAFHVGVAANPCALNFDEERRRLRYKLEAGAEFVVTHPVFDVDDLATFLERVGPIGVPVIAGVRLLENLRRAEFLANEVPGVRVPQRFLDRMRDAEAEGRGFEEGLGLARDLAAAVRPLAQGLQIWAPHEHLDAVSTVAFGLAGAGERASAS
jgi:homocysteine S-methyltransferase